MSDVLHAPEHEIGSFDLEPDADPPKMLVIGPDSTGNVLEIVVLVFDADRLIAIHAMDCAVSSANSLMTAAASRAGCPRRVMAGGSHSELVDQSL